MSKHKSDAIKGYTALALVVVVSGWLFYSSKQTSVDHTTMAKSLETLTMSRSQLVEAVMDEASEGLLICDENWVIMDATLPSTHILGTSRSNIIGASLLYFMDEGTIQAHEDGVFSPDNHPTYCNLKDAEGKLVTVNVHPFIAYIGPQKLNCVLLEVREELSLPWGNPKPKDIPVPQALPHDMEQRQAVYEALQEVQR